MTASAAHDAASPGRLLYAAILIGGIAAWLLSLLVSHAADGQPVSHIWLLRVIVGGLIAMATFAAVRRAPLQLLTPGFVMAAWTYCLFVVGPVLTAISYDLLPEFTRRQQRPLYFLMTYVGSAAEALTLGCVAIILALSAAVVRFAGGAQADRELAGYRRLLLLIRVALAAISAITLWQLLAGAYFPIPPYLLELVIPCVVVVMVTSAYLAGDRVAGARSVFVASIILLVATAGLFLTVKLFALAMAVALSVYAWRIRPRAHLIAIGGIAVLVIVCAVTASVTLARYYNFQTERARFSSAPILEDYVVHPLVSKVVLRQSWTGFCLQNVVLRHGHGGGAEAPSPFIGLVPRVLWPEKPNLSLGSRYATEYCGLDEVDISPISPHSAAITLLGEPIMQGGLRGAAVASIGIALAFAAASLALSRGSAAIKILALSLIPWLADFEQNLSFYVARVTKTALYMIPWIFVLYLFSRRAAPQE